MIETPDVLAIVLCDGLHLDSSTKKPTLIGVFNEVTFDDLPGVIPEFFVYIEATNGRGQVPFVVRIIESSESGPELIKAEGIVLFNDPHVVATVAMCFQRLPFTKEGTYLFQVLFGEAPNQGLAATRRLEVRSRGKKQ